MVEDILKTEYSPAFDELRKKAMAMSYYKYGSVRDNAHSGCTDFIKSLDIRYQEFIRTRNTEYLVDMANLCMMIWMYPQCCGCHYTSTDSKGSPGMDGMSVKELQDYNTWHE